MKVVAFVPIKMNNERLPGKNTKKFSNGKPLILYILETLKKVKGIDDIYVYCSNETIKEYIPENVIYLKRDEYLDKSTTSFNEVLKCFANDVDADIYVLTHATAPFIEAESFEKGIEAVKNNGFDSALSVRKLQEFLWKEGKPFNYDPVHIPRTQDLEPIFTETCGMYIYKSELMKTEGRRVGYHPFLVEVSNYEACDINNPEDFEMADLISKIR